MLRILTPGHPVWRTFIDTGLAMLVVAVSAFFSYTAFTNRAGVAENKAEIIRPRVINKVWIEPSTISSGGSFKVHINATINEVCPGETHWSIIRTSDNVEVARTVELTHPVKLGINDLTITRRVPDTAVPGSYYYVVTVYEFCGPERTTYTAVTPHVPFTIR